MKHTDPAAPAERAGRILTRGRSPDRPTGASPAPGTGRLLGVDLARALAIYGMFAVHVGPSPESVGGPAGLLLSLPQGRSSALFALLAGVSLVLMSGRDTPEKGTPLRRARARIAVRAVILLLLGTALVMIETGISVIIPYYGVFFLLALPALALPARALAALALVSALAGPVLTMAPMVIPGEWLDTFAAYDPINRLSGRGFIDLLLVGAFPAVSWMAYVFAGMAAARLGLASAEVRRRLAAAGAALALIGYGGSWLACHVFTDVQARVDAAAAAASAARSGYNVVDQGSPMERLLVASPHSGSSFEIAGNLGAALLVLVAAVAVLQARPRLGRLAAPVLALGTMSLSAYVGHILVIRYLEPEAHLGSPLAVLAVFLAGGTLAAALWRRLLGRGPLEFLLHFPAIKLSGVVR